MIKTGLRDTQVLPFVPMDSQCAFDFAADGWAVRVGFDLREGGGFFYEAYPTRQEGDRTVFENRRLRRKWSLDYSELLNMLVFHSDDFTTPPDVLGALYNLWCDVYPFDETQWAKGIHQMLIDDMRKGYVRHTYNGTNYADNVSFLLGRGVLSYTPGNSRALGTDFEGKYKITMKGREWLFWLGTREMVAE